MTDKTEQPTPRRLRKLREAGDSPVSNALGAAAALIIAVMLGKSLVSALASRTTQLFAQALHTSDVGALCATLPLTVLELSVPLLASIALASVALGLIQTGGVFTLDKVMPRLARLDPLQGLRARLSGARLFGLLRGLLAALLVAWVALRLIAAYAAELAHSVGSVELAQQTLKLLAVRLGWAAALIALLVAGVDVVAVRRSWLRLHRMSKSEIKRELRESEGDPELKAARRRAYQTTQVGLSLNLLADATLVLVSRTSFAVALRYVEAEDNAPRVLVSGPGELAKQILSAARAYDVPVIAEELAERIREVQAGSEIPSELYESFATILGELLRAGKTERATREASS